MRWAPARSCRGAVLSGWGRRGALLALKAAQDEFHLGGEAPRGAVAVASLACGVEDSTGGGERLLTGDCVAVHAAGRWINSRADTP